MVRLRCLLATQLLFWDPSSVAIGSSIDECHLANRLYSIPSHHPSSHSFVYIPPSYRSTYVLLAFPQGCMGALSDCEQIDAAQHVVSIRMSTY